MNVLDLTGVHIIVVQLADLTGELMRLAIGRISDGELEFAQKICKFVRDIYRELTLVVPFMDDSNDMKTKMDTMLQSVMKIENGIVSTVFLPILVRRTKNVKTYLIPCFRTLLELNIGNNFVGEFFYLQFVNGITVGVLDKF